MHPHSDSDRPSILSFLGDPDVPPWLIHGFFQAAIAFADARPWARLSPASHFPIRLEFRFAPPHKTHAQRLAMIMGGQQSGGDVLGLVLCEGLPDVAEAAGHADSPGSAPGPAPGSSPGPSVAQSGGLSSPALTVIYAGYPDPQIAPIVWRGEPLPRSRSGLLAWPTIHDPDDRVRAPRAGELEMLTAGLLAVSAFVASYPAALLDDGAATPHSCVISVDGLAGPGRVSATTHAMFL